MADETDFELEMQAIEAAEAAATAEAAPAEEAAEEVPAEEAAPAEEAVEEPVEAAAKDEEPPAEEAAETEPEAKKAPKSVPLAELLKEREKRQQAEQALAVERARIEERQRIEAEQRQAEAARQQQPAVEDAIKAEVEKQIGKKPDPAEDPIGADEWDRQYNQRKDAYETQARNARIENDLLVMRLNNERQAFERENPDYRQALEYLKEKRKSFYLKTPAVRRLPEAQRENAALYFVNQEAGMLIKDSQETGVNVAQVVYELAQENGYTKAAPKTEEPAPKQPTAEEKLMTSAAGKKIMSLAAGAGGQAPSVLTDQQIDDMSMEDRDAWLKKSPANQARYRKMLGAED